MIELRNMNSYITVCVRVRFNVHGSYGIKFIGIQSYHDEQYILKVILDFFL